MEHKPFSRSPISKLRKILSNKKLCVVLTQASTLEKTNAPTGFDIRELANVAEILFAYLYAPVMLSDLIRSKQDPVLDEEDEENSSPGGRDGRGRHPHTSSDCSTTTTTTTTSCSCSDSGKEEEQGRGRHYDGDRNGDGHRHYGRPRKTRPRYRYEDPKSEEESDIESEIEEILLSEKPWTNPRFLAVMVKRRQIVFCTIEGGEAPIDPISLDEAKKDLVTREFLQCSELMSMLRNTTPWHRRHIKPSECWAVIFPGGFGCLSDLSRYSEGGKWVYQLYNKERGIVGAVGHGVAALLPISKDGSGISDPTMSEASRWIRRKSIACPTSSEDSALLKHRHARLQEESRELSKELLPFDLEHEIERSGALLDQSKSPFETHVVTSGRLVTAQNTESVRSFTKKFIQVLIKQVTGVTSWYPPVPRHSSDPFRSTKSSWDLKPLYGRPRSGRPRSGRPRSTRSTRPRSSPYSPMRSRVVVKTLGPALTSPSDYVIVRSHKARDRHSGSEFLY